MATVACLLVLTFCTFYVYFLHHDNPQKLGRILLSGIGFCPLAAIVNHNLDGRGLLTYVGPQDIVGPVALMAPAYLMALLGLTSFWKEGHLKSQAIGRQMVWLVAGYAASCLAMVPWSHDPVWSLCALLWALPTFALALVTGLNTTAEDIERDPSLYWATLGLITVNLALVAYGLLTGKATELMATRNFGSVFASNSILAIMVLISPVAFIHAYKNWHKLSLLVLFLVIGAGLTLSRTAAFLVALLGLMLVWAIFNSQRASVAKALGALVPICAAVLVLGAGFFEKFALIQGWMDRFFDSQGGGKLGMALELRADKFALDRASIMAHPWMGKGYGSFSVTSKANYGDMHNMMFTEMYENGAVAFMFVAMSLGAALVAAVVSKHRWKLVPVTASLSVWVVLAYTTGSTLAVRAPDGYTTPIHGALVFFLIGFLVKNSSTEASIA